MIKVIVYHDYYDCDTGCCGHTVKLRTDTGVKSKFKFAHPWYEYGDEEAVKQWARNLVTETYGEEHVADIDWDNCIIEPD